MADLPTPSETERAVRERLAYHENIAARLRNLIRLLWPHPRNDADEETQKPIDDGERFDD